jgi:hypothetical protein
MHRLILITALLTSSVALADEPAPTAARFALIVGVNESGDEDLPTLRYADDDAARWFELLRALGARTYLLTSADESTRKLHAQAIAEAKQPTNANLSASIAALRGDIAAARAQSLPTELYLVYAGHGNRDQYGGYLTLHDARIDASRLFDSIIAPIGADRAHVVVDACYSFFLAVDRGAGGKAKPVTGFVDMERFASSRGNIGLLLSTSTTAKSHEWELYQSGVFSHEVRSGLYGAADADHDGFVSYREIAAFVERANHEVANERFRPRVYARPPAGSAMLADLRSALDKRLEIDGVKSGHWILEDARGVRLVDAHNEDGHAVSLVRPAGVRLYAQREGIEEEITINPSAEPVLRLSELEARPPRSGSRGAAQDAFRLLFAAPFGPDDVTGYVPPSLDEIMVSIQKEIDSKSLSAWFYGGGVLAATGVVLVAGGVIGALASESVLQTPTADGGNKEAARSVGLWSLGGALAGAAVLATGGILMAANLGE